MDRAKSFYIGFLNQQRMHKHMLEDPNGLRTLHPKTPIKWAVLYVLSTRTMIETKDIALLLRGLSYRRSISLIRKGLARCLEFGLVVSQIVRNRKTWTLTKRGVQAVNMPKQPMKETTAEIVRGILAKANQWMAPRDIQAAYTTRKLSLSSIRRALQKEGTHVSITAMTIPGTATTATYKCMKIPGDSYGTSQWALTFTDTTKWDNAAPKVRPTIQRPKKQKKSPAASATGTTNQSYGGWLMCLSATTASKLSLLKAVGDLVLNEFLPANKKFTAHDVTKRLRDIVLAQAKNHQAGVALVDPTETGTVWVQGMSVSKIAHEDVREIVHELFNSGALSGYYRVHNGQHFEYEFGTAPAQVAQPVAAAVQDPTVASTAPATGTSGSAYDGSSTI
jgi:hypothetical protein